MPRQSDTAMMKLPSSGAMAGTMVKLHPYHQHFTHFQIVAVESALLEEDDRLESESHLALLGMVGDWRDTLPLYGGVRFAIRFVAPFCLDLQAHLPRCGSLWVDFGSRAFG